MEPSALAARLGVPAESLSAAAEERYWSGAFDSAQAIWQAELVRTRAAIRPDAEATALMWLGLTAYRLGDYPAARDYGITSLRMKRRLGLDAELSRSFNALGILSWNQGRLVEAQQHFDSATASARRHADRLGEARALGNLGLVLVDLGDYAQSRDRFEQLRAAGVALGDVRLQGNALTNLAMLSMRLGDPAPAEATLDSAQRMYAAIGYVTGEQNALAQLATVRGARGDLDGGRKAAMKALRIARAQGMQQEIASTLEVLADLHTEAGDYAHALALLAEAHSLDSLLELGIDRGGNLRRQAELYYQLGQRQRAIALARAATVAHVAAGAPPEECDDRIQLARYLSAAGATNDATRELERAGALARAIGSRLLDRRVALGRAELALAAGDGQRALRELATPSMPSDWREQAVRQRAHLLGGDLSRARRAGEVAISGAELERDALSPALLRATHLSARLDLYARQLEILVRQGDTAAAFATAAQLAGRGLAEHVGGSTGAATGEAAQLAAEGALLRLIAELEAGLDLARRDGGDRATARLLATRLNEARDQFGRTHQRAAPTGGVLSMQRTALDAIARHLTEGEALVLLVSLPDRVEAYALESNGRVWYATEPVSRRQLEARIRILREFLLGPDARRRADASLRSLGDDMFGGLMRQGAFAGVDRLLIVPHDVIGALPVAALRHPVGGQFLVEAFELAVMPSAAAVPALRSRPEARRADDSASHGSAFAPLPVELPATSREVRAMARLPGWQAVLGPHASEAKVRAALQYGGPVHIATHGTLNARNPLFSRVRLAPGTGASGRDDGWLHAYEVMRLVTRSPLVVLSGCETAMPAAGAPTTTTGAREASLAQAFLHSGASAVVATLWQVRDAPAAELAVAFHRAYEGDATAALARAQRERIRQGGGLDWAAWQVFGGAPAQKGRGRSVSGDNLLESTQ